MASLPLCLNASFSHGWSIINTLLVAFWMSAKSMHPPFGPTITRALMAHPTRCVSTLCLNALLQGAIPKLALISIPANRLRCLGQMMASTSLKPRLRVTAPRGRALFHRWIHSKKLGKSEHPRGSASLPRSLVGTPKFPRPKHPRGLHRRRASSCLRLNRWAPCS